MRSGDVYTRRCGRLDRGGGGRGAGSAGKPCLRSEKQCCVNVCHRLTVLGSAHFAVILLRRDLALNVSEVRKTKR